MFRKNLVMSGKRNDDPGRGGVMGLTAVNQLSLLISQDLIRDPLIQLSRLRVKDCRRVASRSCPFNSGKMS